MHQPIRANHSVIFTSMLNVQADLNDLMGGVQWRNATLENNHGFAYRRAINVEIGEAISYTPYKWWATTEFNKPQFRMELIDVAHFLLSFTHVVQRSGQPFYWAQSNQVYTHLDAMNQGFTNAEDRHSAGRGEGPNTEQGRAEQAVKYLESLQTNLYGRHIGTQVTYTTYDLCGAWENLFNAFFVVFPNFTIEQFLTEYLCKSVLNRFRTANGAKEHGLSYSKNDYLANPARYVKVWADGREDSEHLTDIVEGMLLAGNIDNDKITVELAVQYSKTIDAYARVD